MTITIDLDTILTRIYAESAWHAAYEKDVKVLTPDNARMLEMRIEDGLADLKPRIDAYVTRWNFNRHLEQGNISIDLALPATMDSLTETMRDVIVEMMVNYALMRFYGDEGTHYGTAWRVARARMVIMLGKLQ